MSTPSTIPVTNGLRVSRTPHLRTMRDSDPITGEVWVVDENNHQVACFRVKRPECHLHRATSEVMDASLNFMLANALIDYLVDLWRGGEGQVTSVVE